MKLYKLFYIITFTIFPAFLTENFLPSSVTSNIDKQFPHNTHTLPNDEAFITDGVQATSNIDKQFL